MIVPDTKSCSPITIELAAPGEDIELKAISYIASVLNQLPTNAQQRVLAYLNLRFDEEPTR